jgi:hypothetical protein
MLFYIMYINELFNTEREHKMAYFTAALSLVFTSVSLCTKLENDICPLPPPIQSVSSESMATIIMLTPLYL